MTCGHSNKQIKVCHVTSAHNRYDVRIFHKECRSLANSGYDVTLLVNDAKDNEILDGIKIVSTQFKPNNRFERIVKSKKFIRNKMMEIDADIYHFHDPELLIEALWIKKKGKRTIFDSHEDYLLTVSEKSWIPSILRKHISKLFSIYEEKVISKIDGAIVCYHWTEERYQRLNSMTRMILNFPILTDEKTDIKSIGSRAIAFAGGISPQWCHKEIIIALSNLNNVKYELAGRIVGDYGSELQKPDGWRKVNFHGVLPFSDVMSKVYANASIGMALLDYIAQCKGTVGNLSNTKFFEYMQMGLPLICTDFELWKKIIEEEQCGICVNPHSVDEITEAIRFLLDNPDKAKLMGENGQKAIKKKYNWDTEEDKLLNFYKAIVA